MKATKNGSKNQNKNKKRKENNMKNASIIISVLVICVALLIFGVACGNTVSEDDATRDLAETTASNETVNNAVLAEENQALKSENEALKLANGELKKARDTVQAANAGLKSEKAAIEAENVKLKTAKEAAEVALVDCKGDFAHLIDYYPLYKDDNGELCCGLIWAMNDSLRGDEKNGYGYAATTSGTPVHVLSSYDSADIYFAENGFMVAREGANIILVFDDYKCVCSIYSQTMSGTGLVAGEKTDVSGFSLKETDKVGSLGLVGYKFTAAFVAVDEHVYVLADEAYVPKHVTPATPETVVVEKEVEKEVVKEVEKVVKVCPICGKEDCKGHTETVYVEVPGETKIIERVTEKTVEVCKICGREDCKGHTKTVYVKVPGEKEIIYVPTYPENNPHNDFGDLGLNEPENNHHNAFEDLEDSTKDAAAKVNDAVAEINGDNTESKTVVGNKDKNGDAESKVEKFISELLKSASTPENSTNDFSEVVNHSENASSTSGDSAIPDNNSNSFGDLEL